ncbi:MAG: hypothetical protein J2P26_03635, partial [Nocardiopsaceae bacterium]|nr:hypothetical protein [Nocardiopsaceae bacterium]
MTAAEEVRRVADAVLYEGYILYPYRASAQKNQSRWQWGVLVPPAFAAADPSETAAMRAECVFEHSGDPSVEVTVRFLQVQRRHCDDGTPDWDEAVEQEVTVTAGGQALLEGGAVHPFGIQGGEDAETVNGVRTVRRRQPLTGTVSVRATELPGPWGAARLAIEVTNATGGTPGTRDEALPGALVAAHMIITVSGGSFVSMTDPPEWASPAVAECESVGCWPTLAGPKDSKNIMLASPIILPEYAEIAAESPGELYD